MKKRLLFAALAMMCAGSTFAFDEGDYTYTNTGRVKIEGANLFETGSTNLEGWTDAEGSAPNSEVWAIEPAVGENGEDAIQSLAATEGAALCRVFSLDPGTYVVSYQIRATGDTNSGTTTIGTTVGSNYADIFINTTGNLAKATSTEEAPVVDVAAAANFSEEWKTVSYLCTVEEGQYLVLHFEKLATGIQLTNFSLNEAEEVYDIRIAESKLAFAKQLLEDPNFNIPAAADARDNLLNDVIPTIEGAMEAGALDDASTAEDMLSGFEEAFNSYLDASSVDMVSLLPGLDIDNLATWGRGGNYSANYKLNLQGGNWGHIADDHALRSAIQTGYANTATYNVFHEDFPAGKYFFTAEIRNANTGRTSWPTEPVFNLTTEGCTMFIGSTSIDLDPISGEQYQRFYIIADLYEGEQFNAGVYWPGTSSGGAFFIRNTSVRAFNMDILAGVEHVQAYKAYKTQWDAAVNARNGLIDKISNTNYPWDQQVLKDAQAKWDPYFLAQEAKGWLTADGADAGIATTDEFNDWALYQGVEEYTTNEETGEQTRLQYQVVRGYQNASNAVIATNKPFTDLATAIDAAKAERNKGVNFTGDRDTFKAAIEKAITTIQAIRKSTKDATREEDTQKLNAALEELLAAQEAFLASVTGSTPMIDIDFSNGFEEQEDGTYTISGELGAMSFSHVDTANEMDDTDPGNGAATPFALGYGAETLKDVLRIGSSDATVALDGITADDAVTVKFDLWVGSLSGCNTYIDLRNANNERVAGFSINRYNGSLAYNDFNNEENTGLDLLKYVTGIGSSSAQNGSICVDNNKSSFTLSIDYKAGMVRGAIVNGKNGSQEGINIPMQELEDNIITKFVVGSNYKRFVARRSWFDNLKITKSTAHADLEEDIDATPWGENTDGVKGDVNADMVVDVADISSIISVMAGTDTEHAAAADVNGDGTVDVADISTVIAIMAANARKALLVEE